jgi:hypothetical protein
VQLLASQEGLFSVTFIFILVMILTVKMHSFHDRGQINVMFILQSCRDSLHILSGSSSETFPTSSDGTYDVSNTEFEWDVVVIEEGFVAVNGEVDIGIKQEEIPEDITFLDIKAEPDQVCNVCMCLLSDTFYQCSEMSVVFF